MLKNKIDFTKQLTIKRQILAGIIAVASAVVLPTIFHLLGAISGLGTALGEVLLPMHLPIMLAALLCGPYVGAVSGLLSPLVSFLISGMPGAVMLPFMMIELCSYGLLAGALKNVKINSFFKVLLTQIGGRAIRAIAIAMAVYLFGNTRIGISVIWTSIMTGLIGIALQLVLIPLLLYRIDGRK